MNELQETKDRMTKAIEFLKMEFSKLRVGRATTSMVDGVSVDAYGSAMNLKEVATVNAPDARTITIQPWDKGVIGNIERAILAANLGITPMNDGNIIRITLPPLTEERRKEFAKQIKQMGEDAKVSIRSSRRDAIDAAKKKEELSEDEMRRFQDDVQKLTDQYTKECDTLVEKKSKDVMSL